MMGFMGERGSTGRRDLLELSSAELATTAQAARTPTAPGFGWAKPRGAHRDTSPKRAIIAHKR